MVSSPKIAFEFQQTQSLVMTPQLQQAIKLLQCSHMDLTQWVMEQAEQNPFLEANVPAVTLSSGNLTPYKTSPAYTKHADIQAIIEQTHEQPLTLKEYLLEQIYCDISNPTMRLIAQTIVYYLDENGYITDGLEDIAATIGCPLEEVLSTLSIIQKKCEPSGIFARNLKECLQLQLQSQNIYDDIFDCLLNHLTLFAAHDYEKLQKLTHISAQRLKEYIDIIKTLNPKPGFGAFAENPQTLVPDLIMHPHNEGGWIVELNPETLPKILVNESLWMHVKQNHHLNKQDKLFLSEHIQNANWVVKAIEQRAHTILKVARALIEHQYLFFEKGIKYLLPLTLKDIAQKIDMHESTVSRVSHNKYIATPRGVFELKYFFSNALAAEGGEEHVSAEYVRHLIRQLIHNETYEAILSDEDISQKLKQDDIHIARRTVAKYRESLQIPTSSHRKRLKKAYFSADD